MIPRLPGGIASIYSGLRRELSRTMNSEIQTISIPCYGEDRFARTCTEHFNFTQYRPVEEVEMKPNLVVNVW
jgi:hypothetical protein